MLGVPPFEAELYDRHARQGVTAVSTRATCIESDTLPVGPSDYSPHFAVKYTNHSILHNAFH